jgi:Icc protein
MIMLIAHVTDFHLLETGAGHRRGASRARLAFLSNGRPIDPKNRRQRAVDALIKVREAAPDHVCITGDLTEDGTDAQFEVLAEVLAASGLDPSRVTLVPGNHDAYTYPDGLARALAGPLAAYHETSALGSVVEREGYVVLPVGTTMPQCFIRAAGYVGDEGRALLERALRHTEAKRLPSIVAMHHPPVRTGRNPLAWFDALLDAREVTRVLAPFHASRVLHGHLHRHTNESFGGDTGVRAHGARAVADHVSPVRLYTLEDQGLVEIA